MKEATKLLLFVKTGIYIEEDSKKSFIGVFTRLSDLGTFIPL